MRRSEPQGRPQAARGSEAEPDGGEVQPASSSSSSSHQGRDGFQHVEGSLLQEFPGVDTSSTVDLLDDWEDAEAGIREFDFDFDDDDDDDDDDDGIEDDDDEDEEGEEGTRGALRGEVLGIDQLLDEGLDPERSLDQLCSMFPFEMDKFQKKSVEHMLKGRSVVVCAPTGAGKTCIAEAVAAATLAKGQRVIYTTPLKALSNQKLLEMRETFGEHRLGLQTGDASLNAEADVVVMTTEILRNIMYRTEAEASSGGQPSRLADVGLIVLDEVHYLGDPNRGSVWEEVIINCPPHIQMLCMSATVQNPRDLGAWIEQVHGPCETVITKFRPIPLNWNFCWKDRNGPELVRLLDRKQKNVNGKILDAMQNRGRFYGRGDQRGPSRGRSRQLPSVNSMDVVHALRGEDMLPAIFFIFSRRDCDANVQSIVATGRCLISAAERVAIQGLLDDLRAAQPEAVREDAVEGLMHGAAAHHAGMLPAWKKLVEKAFQSGLLKVIFATETLAAGINMPARTTVISVMSRRRGGSISLLTHNELLQMAGRAGRRGFDDIGHVVVMQSRWDGATEAVQVLQRGPEALASQFSTSYGMVLSLLTSKSLDSARSFVERSFGNYLGGEGLKRKMQEIEELERRAQILMAKVQAAEAQVASQSNNPVVLKYNEVQGLVKQDRRSLRRLRRTAREDRGHLAGSRVSASGGLPCLVGLDLPEDDKIWTTMIDEDYDPELSIALLVGELSDLQIERMGLEVDKGLPVYLALGSDNRILAIASHYIAAVAEGGTWPRVEAKMSERALLALEQIDPQQSVKQGSWSRLNGDYFSSNGGGITAALAVELPSEKSCCLQPTNLPEELLAEIEEQLKVLKKRRKELSSLKRHPAMRSQRKGAAKGRSTRRQAADENKDEGLRAEKLMKRADRMRGAMERQLTASWTTFEEMVSILVDFGALKPDTLELLPLGMVAREIRGENELWLAACLTHPATQYLDPAPLAGLIAGLVAADMMGTRPNLYVAYPPSEEVVQAAAELEDVRERLEHLQMSTTSVSCSMVVDLRFSGLVEAWASGSSWFEITSDTSLDEGDVARLLGRTADLMRQVTFINDLLPDIQENARASLKTMMRVPISDLVT